MVYIATPALGLVASAMIMGNIHVCRLANEKESTVATLYGGALNGATSVYLGVKIASEHGFHRRYSFTVLAGLWSIVIINTIFFLPSYKVELPKDKEVPETTQEKKTESKPQEEESAKKCTRCPPTLPPIVHSCFSPLFIMYCIWFLILHIRLQTFTAGANMWLNEIFDNDSDKVSHYINVMGYMDIASAFVFSFPVGLLVDVIRKAMKDDSRPAQMVAAVPTLSIAITTALVVSVAVLFSSDQAAYVAVLFMPCYRNWFYNICLPFLALAFSMQEFGRLMGILFVLAGSLGFVVQPLLTWAQADGFTNVRNILSDQSLEQLKNFHCKTTLQVIGRKK